MFSKVHTVGIRGVEGYPILVEADVSDGLPGFTMVGYLASEVREAQDRVRTAIRNSGFKLAAKKVTINLSPADIRKEGTAFDLPIAVAVLAASGIIDPSALRNCIISGELGLDGEVKPVRGTLSITEAAKKDGKTRCFLPEENVEEGLITEEMAITGVNRLRQLVDYLNCPSSMRTAVRGNDFMTEEQNSYDMDFSEINGQLLLRRATEVAVAGMHNILYIGPAGAGKTMAAQRIPTIMPTLSLEENIEISKIYSICGLLPADRPLLSRRPFRSPHHTITPQALTGGGRIPRPGEISLASGGVLFLDELPEFQKRSIEVLRQPMEERKITISRIHGSYDYPANVMISAAMNPCSCGYYPDRSKCRCTQQQVKNYINRISKPLLDRMDISVEASPLTYEEMQGTGGESSSVIRQRVEKARIIQRDRLEGSGIYFNSSMKQTHIADFCKLGTAEKVFLKQVFSQMDISARGYNKILKVARTIADLEGSLTIEKEHLAEAVGYRNMETKYWGGSNG